MFQHVGWSLRHVLFSDMFSAVSNLFSTSLVYACPVYGRSGMLFLLLISRGTVFVFASFVLLACLVCYVPACWMVAPACCFYHFLHVYSSGMFLLSACFGMFDFGMFKYCLLSACCIPRTQHTHTCGQVLVLLVTGRAQLPLHVFFFACLRMSCLWQACCYLTAGCAT